VIQQAAFYLASADDLAAARLSVVGRPVAFRAIVAAVRAGARRVAVPSALRSAELVAALDSSPSARAALVWMDNPGALAYEPTLLLPVAALAPPGALRSLRQVGPGHVLPGSRETGAPALTVTAARLDALAPTLAVGAPVGDDLAKSEAAPAPAAAWFVRVTDAATARAAEARLWGELGSPIDTRLDQVVHRRLSRGVTRAAVALGIGPNPITAASGLVGLAAAAVFARGEVAALLGGLALYLAAVVLDHTDGEVARLSLSESAVGEWLDIVVDTIVHTALVLALGAAASQVTGAGLGAGVIAAVGVVAGATVGKVWPPAPPSAGRRRGLDALTSRDGFYAMLVLFIALRLGAPSLLPVLMAVVAAGTHAYWIGRVVLLNGGRKTARKPK
jgi:phosphatidylglycerophosphate synthase